MMREFQLIAELLFNRTGCFLSRDVALPLSCSAEPSAGAEEGGVRARRQRQRGVIRTNCVDCLDRTNVAQFCIGTTALGHQLYALGLRRAAALSFADEAASGITTVLAGMYERLGDVVARQYGGSGAHAGVISIISKSSKGPGSTKKESPQLADKLADSWKTLGRHYSNQGVGFNNHGFKNRAPDALKQMGMNLLLGKWRPYRDCRGPPREQSLFSATPTGAVHLWELESDNYLHNSDDGWRQLAAESDAAVRCTHAAGPGSGAAAAAAARSWHGRGMVQPLSPVQAGRAPAEHAGEDDGEDDEEPWEEAAAHAGEAEGGEEGRAARRAALAYCHEVRLPSPRVATVSSPSCIAVPGWATVWRR
jgi:hypothetical protein